jgi:hypothetical protein
MGRYLLVLPLFLFSFFGSPAGSPPVPGPVNTRLAANPGMAASPSIAAGSPVAAGPSSGEAYSLADSARLIPLYDSLRLDSLELSRDAYNKAVRGFLTLVAGGEVANAEVLSIIDFTLPSNKKRLFILDMRTNKLLFNTLVAHGRNSGKLMATHFSNRRNSYMSSLGFYVTGEPFIGQHGYSLRLEGKEKGLNDHVLSRSIVIHPADYVSEDFVQQWGFLGRSEGCPAIPKEWDEAIIGRIRGGSCLFLYGGSQVINKKNHR